MSERVYLVRVVDDDAGYVPPRPPASPSWERIAAPFCWGSVEVTPLLLRTVCDEFMARPDRTMIVESSASAWGARDVPSQAAGVTDTLEMRGHELWARVAWSQPERPQPPLCLCVALQIKGSGTPKLVGIAVTATPLVQPMMPVQA